MTTTEKEKKSTKKLLGCNHVENYIIPYPFIKFTLCHIHFCAKKHFYENRFSIFRL